MSPARVILIFLVRMYRWGLSPAKTALFGPLGRCRFTPTCSQYALEALQRHGALLGTGLAARRICRCHPWGGCGCDPVPDKPFEVPGSRIAGSRFPLSARGGSLTEITHGAQKPADRLHC